MNRESFIFYKSFYEASKFLENEEKWKLFDMICQYWLYGNEIEWEWASMWMFLLIKPQLDANNKRYINWCKWKEFWEKWWAPKWNQNAVKNWKSDIKQPQNNPKTTPNDNDNVNDNEKENNNENQNQEHSQDINVSIPKQDTNITPNLTNGDLTFENIYNLFYHKSWHKPSIDKCRKVFESLKLDTEWYNMLVKDLNLFRIEYKYWIKDQMYRPWFEKYVGWFNAEWVNEEYRLKTIIKFHMENRDDIEKMKKRYKDLCDTFWKDTIDKLVKEYGRAKNKITLNIN